MRKALQNQMSGERRYRIIGVYKYELLWLISGTV